MHTGRTARKLDEHHSEAEASHQTRAVRHGCCKIGCEMRDSPIRANFSSMNNFREPTCCTLDMVFDQAADLHQDALNYDDRGSHMTSSLGSAIPCAVPLLPRIRVRRGQQRVSSVWTLIPWRTKCQGPQPAASKLCLPKPASVIC